MIMKTAFLAEKSARSMFCIPDTLGNTAYLGQNGRCA